MEFMDAVLARRSIRRFAPKAVPEGALADILEAARHAPSSGGVSSTYLGVVRDESIRRSLAAASGGQEWIATAPVIIALCTRLNPDPATMAKDDFFLQVNTDRFGRDLIEYLNAFPDRRAARLLWDTGAALIPGEHVALAATAHGLASCWIGHLDIAKVSALLGLPDGIACTFLVPIGYPDETPAEKTLRPIEECVFYDTWNPDARAGRNPGVGDEEVL
ncbi:MAG: nitroreductase family protein [Micromonosporaceae bacterium]|nr:nitroreductase family protein [Micromonosporaceae bacterium]